MNTMDQIKVRYEKSGDIVPLSDFLNAKKLSERTQKIQEAVRTLYQLQDPPLFHLPNFPAERPLMIDCIIPLKGDSLAHYHSHKHVIQFASDLSEEQNLPALIDDLAYALTYAEQDLEEINRLEHTNALIFRQIAFLKQARAFARQFLVRTALQYGLDAPETLMAIHKPTSETVLVQEILKQLFGNPSYVNDFANKAPVRPNDTHLQKIPGVFHLNNALLFPTLDNIPTRVDEKSISYHNLHPEKMVKYFNDPRNDDKSRAICAGHLLSKFLKDIRTTPETLPRDLERIDFLLTLKRKDGTPLLPDSVLPLLFRNHEQKGLTCFLFLNADKAVDANGKKIFPENFSEKVRKMTVSELSRTLRPYLNSVSKETLPLVPASKHKEMD